jgi:hypothetical protein
MWISNDGIYGKRSGSDDSCDIDRKRKVISENRSQLEDIIGRLKCDIEEVEAALVEKCMVLEQHENTVHIMYDDRLDENESADDDRVETDNQCSTGDNV